MKQITVTEEEAKAIYEELRKSWITPDNQKIVFHLLERIERELEIE